MPYRAHLRLRLISLKHDDNYEHISILRFRSGPQDNNKEIREYSRF